MCGCHRHDLAVVTTISCECESAQRAWGIIFPLGSLHHCHIVLLLQCCSLYQLILGIASTHVWGAHLVLRPSLAVAFPLFCLLLIPTLIPLVLPLSFPTLGNAFGFSPYFLYLLWLLNEDDTSSSASICLFVGTILLASNWDRCHSRKRQM